MLNFGRQQKVKRSILARRCHLPTVVFTNPGRGILIAFIAWNTSTTCSILRRSNTEYNAQNVPLRPRPSLIGKLECEEKKYKNHYRKATEKQTQSPFSHFFRQFCFSTCFILSEMYGMYQWTNFLILVSFNHFVKKLYGLKEVFCFVCLLFFIFLVLVLRRKMADGF